MYIIVGAFVEEEYTQFAQQYAAPGRSTIPYTSGSREEGSSVGSAIDASSGIIFSAVFFRPRLSTSFAIDADVEAEPDPEAKRAHGKAIAMRTHMHAQHAGQLQCS